MFFVDQGRIRPQGVIDAEDAGKRFNINGDERQGLRENGSVFRQDKGDGIAAMADLVGAQNRLILMDDPLSIRSGHITAGENGNHTGKVLCLSGIEPAYPAVGNPGTPDACPKEPVSVVIRGILFLPRHLGFAISPGDGATDFRDK